MLHSIARDPHRLCCHKAGAGCWPRAAFILHPRLALPPLLSFRRPAGGGEGASTSPAAATAPPVPCSGLHQDLSPRNTSSLAPCKIPCVFTEKKDSCQHHFAVLFVVVLDSNEYLRPDPRLLLSSFLLMKHFSSYKSFLKSLDR